MLPVRQVRLSVGWQAHSPESVLDSPGLASAVSNWSASRLAGLRASGGFHFSSLAKEAADG